MSTKPLKEKTSEAKMRKTIAVSTFKRTISYRPRAMSHLVAFILILGAGVLGFGENAEAWTGNIDFESGNVIGADGFGYIDSVYLETDIAQHGNNSARAHFIAGTKPCGGKYYNEGDVLCGDELWTRVYYYFPAGWDWGSLDGNHERKILRFNLRTAEGTYAGGMLSVIGYWRQPNNGEIVASNEPGAYKNEMFTGVNFPIGRWFSLEQYVLFGTTDETARHIIWLDGNKIFDSADLPNTDIWGNIIDKKTMLNSTDCCSSIFFFSHWNGRVRTTQNAYMDNIIITTDTPSNTDAGGFPMIGQVGLFLHGDVTNDGSVDITDIQACMNHILGTQDWGEAADINNDGAVNILDVQEVVSIILGG